MDWYRIATDLGSIIGGILALIAAVIASLVALGVGLRQGHETRQAAEMQLEAAARRDRLQALCIAVGIYPEIARIKADHFLALHGREQISHLLGDVRLHADPSAATCYIGDRYGPKPSSHVA